MLFVVMGHERPAPFAESSFTGEPSSGFAMLIPVMGHELAELQPVSVPLLLRSLLLRRAPPLAGARDQYVYLNVTRFWIPPGTDSACGVWSNPVLMVIGAPTPPVDAVPVDCLKAFQGARTLAPGSFCGRTSSLWSSPR
jgi:hypothetical protein